MLADGQQSCHKLRTELRCPAGVPLVAWSSAAANLDSATCATILDYVATASCIILEPFVEQMRDVLPERAPVVVATLASAAHGG